MRWLARRAPREKLRSVGNAGSVRAPAVTLVRRAGVAGGVAAVRMSACGAGVGEIYFAVIVF